MPEPNKSSTVPNFPEAAVITTTSAKLVDSPHYQSFYCNNVGFALNQLDIVLYFNEIIDVSSTGEGTIERKARVTMNPAQAKSLISILDNIIKMYESQNGPIKEIAAGFVPIKVKS